MDLAIIPECYVDTNLIETIAPPLGRGYNHQKGCGTVTKVMRGNFADSFALGIIDKDKRQVEYLKEFDEEINTGSLILHKHKTKHHYIIQICPDVEGFFVKSANAAFVSMEDFGLPSDMPTLKKVSKQAQSKKDPQFKSLFNAIKRAGDTDFAKLAAWVLYLRDNPYSANIGNLKLL